MSLFTSYEVDNDKSFNRLINDSLKVVEDLSPAFGLISDDFYTSQRATFGNAPGLYPDYFDNTTGTEGRNTPYAQRKMDKTGRSTPYPMLVFTGRLSKSLMEPDAPNNDSVLVIGKKSLAIGTKVDYGIYHQSDKPRRKIPLRKFLFIGPENRRYANSDQIGRVERWNRIMKDYIVSENKRKKVI